jgi:pimeloyl-ACP methyl ester carboxylesterase
VGLLWDGYSAADQTISELSAIGAPTRPLWMALGTIYSALMIAFGWIVWKSAPNRALRIVGALLVTQAVFGIFWPPMHQRAALAAGGATWTDTLHIVWTIVTSAFFMGALGFGAAGLGKRFRFYSLATMVIVFACGAGAGSYAPAIQSNLATPLVGVWERINTSAFMVWIAVLAIALLRADRAWRRTMSYRSAFRSDEGEARFLAAYDRAMSLWPVPWEQIDVRGRFGTTHVVMCGSTSKPPLVLLHGYMATSTMWSPNIAAFSQDYRVYAIDVMGQPSKSRPEEPICNAADFVAWLTTTLDALRLDRVFLVGMSFGGWLALNYAVAVPQRVRKLVLLSPGGLLPMVRQFTVRGMLMVWLPTRLTVNSFFAWLGFSDRAHANVLELIYLGLKHFRMPLETARVLPAVVSDEKLRTMNVPTLLLIGDREVISDPARALERARRLIPSFEGELVPGCRHDMCASQHEIVDVRVLEFLEKTRADDSARAIERSIA